MSPLLENPFRVFCVFHGLSNAARCAEDGWDSRPYLGLTTFGVTCSAIAIFRAWPSADSAHDHAGSHGVVGLLINQHKAACCAVSPIAIEMNRRTGLQRDTGDIV